MQKNVKNNIFDIFILIYTRVKRNKIMEEFIKWGWFDKERLPRQYRLSVPFNEISAEEAFKVAMEEKSKFYDSVLSEDEEGAVQLFTYMFRCDGVEHNEIYFTGGKYLYSEKMDFVEDLDSEISMYNDYINEKDKNTHHARGKYQEYSDKKKVLTLVKRMVTLEDMLA